MSSVPPHSQYTLKSLFIWVAVFSVSLAILSLVWRGSDEFFLLLPLGGSLLGATLGSPAGHFIGGPNGKRVGTMIGAAIGFLLGLVPIAIGLWGMTFKFI